MLRARQTAKEILRYYPRLTLHTQKGLLEVDHQIAGLHFEKLIKNKDSFYSGKRAAKESPEEIAYRMLGTIEKVIRVQQGRAVVLISHGDPIIFCLLALLGYKFNKQIVRRIELAAYGTRFSNPVCYPEKCSIYKLTFATNSRTLKKLNYISPASLPDKSGKH